MDGGGADAVAEFAEFALDALIAPGRVLPGHSFDQHGDGLVEGWATAAGGGRSTSGQRGGDASAGSWLG